MDPSLDDPASHSILTSVDTVLEIVHAKLLMRKKEIDYDLALREIRLDAKQRIALKRLNDTIQQQYALEGISDVQT